ncbi:MAG: putative protein YciH [Anaerolineales bacterium]|nr:putative protein YciH [Anaerolineales bacterium]
MSDSHRTVWSSEEGDLRKKKNFTPAPTGSGVLLPPQRRVVYLHREKSRRGGKSVILVRNLALSEEALKTLAKLLKQECGTGGTVKDGVIEIQGEQRERIASVLLGLGYQVKLAGG